MQHTFMKKQKALDAAILNEASENAEQVEMYHIRYTGLAR
jgi:hypothetical protein